MFHLRILCLSKNCTKEKVGTHFRAFVVTATSQRIKLRFLTRWTVSVCRYGFKLASYFKQNSPPPTLNPLRHTKPCLENEKIICPHRSDGIVCVYVPVFNAVGNTGFDGKHFQTKFGRGNGRRKIQRKTILGCIL